MDGGVDKAAQDWMSHSPTAQPSRQLPPLTFRASRSIMSLTSDDSATLVPEIQELVVNCPLPTAFHGSARDTRRAEVAIVAIDD